MWDFVSVLRPAPATLACFEPDSFCASKKENRENGAAMSKTVFGIQHFLHGERCVSIPINPPNKIQIGLLILLDVPGSSCQWELGCGPLPPRGSVPAEIGCLVWEAISICILRNLACVAQRRQPHANAIQLI